MKITFNKNYFKFLLPPKAANTVSTYNKKVFQNWKTFAEREGFEPPEV